jgi:hypothetical protein
MKYLTVFLTAGCACAHTGHFDRPGPVHSAADASAYDIEASWSNRYLSEGRKAFGNNGVFAILGAATYGNHALELWSGFSDGSAGREFEAVYLHSFTGIPCNPTLGIGHINDFRGETEEWEFSLGLVGELGWEIEWLADMAYNPEANGIYLEAGLARTFVAAGFEITPSTHIGANAGYVADGHNGPDHIAVELMCGRGIGESITLNAIIAYYEPISKNASRHPDDADLYRGLHLTFSIGASF